MLLTPFRYPDMRDEVRVVHGYEITRGGFVYARFCTSRDLVCIHWMAGCAQCKITRRCYIFYKATDLMVNLSLEDCMNFRSQVGRSRFFYYSVSRSVSVVNKNKCKLTYQGKNTFFQDPLIVVNFFVLILQLLIFPGFRYVHFPISTCNHSIKQDQKICVLYNNYLFSPWWSLFHWCAL